MNLSSQFVLCAQLGGVSILEAAISEMLAPAPDTGAAGGDRRATERRIDMFGRPYGQPGVRSASAARNAMAQERRAHAAAVAEQHHRVHEAMVQRMQLRRDSAEAGAATATGAVLAGDAAAAAALHEAHDVLAAELEQQRAADDAVAAGDEAQAVALEADEAAAEAQAAVSALTQAEAAVSALTEEQAAATAATAARRRALPPVAPRTNSTAQQNATEQHEQGTAAAVAGEAPDADATAAQQQAEGTAQEEAQPAAQQPDVEMAATSEDEARSQGEDAMDTAPPAGASEAPAAASQQQNEQEQPAADDEAAQPLLDRVRDDAAPTSTAAEGEAAQGTDATPAAAAAAADAAGDAVGDAAPAADAPQQDAQNTAGAPADAGPSTTAEPDAAAAPAAAGDVAAEPAENGILTARVRERAAAAGLDVGMLEALPSDLVRETLLAYGVDPTDRGAGGADDSRAALSAMIPAELLSEGLAAEREAALRRSQQAAAALSAAAPAAPAVAGAAPAEGAAVAEADPARAAAADFAATVASFPPDALEDALASLSAEVTEHLPGPLRTQAMRLQGRRNFRSLRELTDLRAAQRTAAGRGTAGAAPRDVPTVLSQVVLREFPEASVLPTKPATPQTPSSDLSTKSLAVIIKIIACNANSSTSSSTSAWMSQLRTQADIQESASAILLGCLSSQESVTRVCSLFLSTIGTFMVEPPRNVPGSSAAPKFVWGLSLSRASLCPSTPRAGVVLSVLLDTMQDLSQFDRYVAQYALLTHV